MSLAVHPPVHQPELKPAPEPPPTRKPTPKPDPEATLKHRPIADPTLPLSSLRLSVTDNVRKIADGLPSYPYPYTPNGPNAVTNMR